MFQRRPAASLVPSDVTAPSPITGPTNQPLSLSMGQLSIRKGAGILGLFVLRWRNSPCWPVVPQRREESKDYHMRAPAFKDINKKDTDTRDIISSGR